MTDYTIRLKNIPHHKFYEDHDDVLRSYLTAHFQQVIKDEIEYVRSHNEWRDADDDGVNDYDDIRDIKADGDILQPLDYEIADICFGHSNIKEMQILSDMADLQNEYSRNVLRK